MKFNYLDSRWQQSRGVIGRYPDPNECYVFRFDTMRPRLIHMVGVRRPLRVEWWANGDMVATERLRPWIGMARHPADEIREVAV